MLSSPHGPRGGGDSLLFFIGGAHVMPRARLVHDLGDADRASLAGVDDQRALGG